MSTQHDNLMQRGITGGALTSVVVANNDSLPVIVSSPTGVPISIDVPAAGRDSFGRQRVASPFTVFDSKLIHDAEPLLWDDAATSGGGTSTSHSANRASSTIGVSNTTAGTRVRQTFQRFNYQPGKSQLIFMTGILGAGSSGITRRVGLFDANNGVFFQLQGTTLSVVRRTNVSGTPQDNPINQSDWNVDKMNGSGASGVNINTALSQIFVIDFEWLGVGTVRFGFVIDGAIIYCHHIHNANILSSVYMSTPNLPLRYEISNDGNGPAATLEHICTTVISEGGVEPVGKLHYASTDGVHLNADTADTLYALIGIRLKSAYIGSVLYWEIISMLEETNGNFEWALLLNPTVAGTFNYSDVTNACFQKALGATTNTVTGGTPMLGGFAAARSEMSRSVGNAIRLGSSIAGTVDAFVLCVRPLANNLDIQASITLRQI